MTTQRGAFALAVAATGTAVTLSVLSGWQRGGTLPERLVWVAIGVVLVVTAHLLPALARSANLRVRFVSAGLWLGCMGAAIYGHTVFFLLAQMHAGEMRAASVAPPAMPSSRSLTAVMDERATVTAQLTAADVRRCVRDCPSLRVRRASLAARLDALNVEAGEIRQREAVTDRVTTRRDALLADPVTSRLAGLLGMTAPHIDLLSGLLFASVLEGVACLLWMLALEASPLPESALVVGEPTPSAVVPVAPETAETEPVVTSAAASHVDETANHESGLPSHDSTTHSRTPRDDPLRPLPDVGAPRDDVTQLTRDIAAGHLRPTVAEIRRHLGCSQAKAASLRRQLAARHTAA